MPMYDYSCTTCEIVVERIVYHSDMDEQYCECGEKLIRAEMSLTGKPVFKGTGYYETDYKHKV